MEEHPHYQSASRRAWRDTKHSFHTIKFFLGVEVVTMGVFIFFATLLIPENASRLVSAGYPAVGAMIGAVVGFGLIYLVMLVKAPYRQRNEARVRVVELEDELKKPKLFDVECRTTTKMLPIKLKEDGTWETYAKFFSPSPINIIHRGDLINVTSVTMALVVLFNHMDGSLETTDAITITPQRRLPAFLSAPGALDFAWDISNPLQWVLKGLPLTMRKDECLPLPAMDISVQDVNLVGEHFTKLDWCKVVISLRIRTDKGSPHIPDLFIELTSSDIPNPNPRYYWKDVTNEPKD